MKAIFSIVALLLVLGITSLLVKKQLGTTVMPTVPPTSATPGAATAPATPANQVQQVGKQVEGMLQQPRPQAPEQ
jgi:multidrug efflux pump subunit AcrB